MDYCINTRKGCHIGQLNNKHNKYFKFKLLGVHHLLNRKIKLPFYGYNLQYAIANSNVINIFVIVKIQPCRAQYVCQN